MAQVIEVNLALKGDIQSSIYMLQPVEGERYMVVDLIILYLMALTQQPIRKKINRKKIDSNQIRYLVIKKTKKPPDHKHDNNPLDHSGLLDTGQR